jgi:hypothetical protein
LAALQGRVGELLPGRAPSRHPLARLHSAALVAPLLFLRRQNAEFAFSPADVGVERLQVVFCRRRIGGERVAPLLEVAQRLLAQLPDDRALFPRLRPVDYPYSVDDRMFDPCLSG